MDWFRNLSPRGKRVAIVAGGAGLAVIIILISRRSAGAPAAASSTTTDASAQPAGVLPAAYLPNSGYDSSTSDQLADVHDLIDELRGEVAAIPSPTGSSEISQIVADQLRPIRDEIAATRTVTPAAPVAAPQAPAAPAPQPAAAPKPAATGPTGGRKVGPWATKEMRTNALKGIPPNKVRIYSEGGKFYAEIFD